MSDRWSAESGCGTYWSATSVTAPQRLSMCSFDENGPGAHMSEVQRHWDTVGKEFAVNYFGELTVWEQFLERYCDSESRFVFQHRHGRRWWPDRQVQGAAAMIKFAVHAKFRHTNVQILAVYTIKYRDPNWYSSLTVCKWSCPGKEEEPRTLLQSTIFRYAPSSTNNRNFTIVCAVLKFRDGRGF